ncbi:MAG: TolC family protein [Sulfurimonas sp.]|nr:TolC family protein [Sulfurimonas sp.]
MLKKIIIISALSFIVNADVISFYKSSLNTLQYDKTYSLYENSNKISQSGITYGRYTNFNVDASYSRNNAKLLNRGFNTTNLSLNNTLDLFGKNSYRIKLLSLDLQAKKMSLDIQKEQLFISLTNMIYLYNRTFKYLSLYKKLFDEQAEIYKKLKLLEQSGGISNLDILRFENTLTSFKIKIIAQESELTKMKQQLNLYAPNEQIPSLSTAKLLYAENDFLTQNPLCKLNTIGADKHRSEAQGLNDSYIPVINAGLVYQKLDDPTSYGDNYSFNISIHISFNASIFKEAESLKVEALSLESQNIKYKMQRENQYITRYQNYINATKQLKVLEESLSDYKKSEKGIKAAYMKQHIDFNIYLQVLIQSLHIKKQIIDMKYQRNLEATILNNISSGVVYE